MAFEPNAINVIPTRAVLNVDLRDPDEPKLQAAEVALARYLDDLAQTESVAISTERLARSAPVTFDRGIVELIEQAATRRGLRSRRMTSGAGHDAQMMQRICPTAMIFVPSVAGLSHNVKEHTDAADLAAGAQVLLNLMLELAG